MKIIISFTAEEKNMMTEMYLNNGIVNEVVDKDEHYAGNFGEFKYCTEKNEIVVDLKSSFIKAYMDLINHTINMIKAFASTLEVFSSVWFEDTKDLTKKDEEAESQDFAAEVESAIKE